MLLTNCKMNGINILCQKDSNSCIFTNLYLFVSQHIFSNPKGIVPLHVTIRLVKGILNGAFLILAAF